MFLNVRLKGDAKARFPPGTDLHDIRLRRVRRMSVIGQQAKG